MFFVGGRERCFTATTKSRAHRYDFLSDSWSIFASSGSAPTRANWLDSRLRYRFEIRGLFGSERQSLRSVVVLMRRLSCRRRQEMFHYTSRMRARCSPPDIDGDGHQPPPLRPFRYDQAHLVAHYLTGGRLTLVPRDLANRMRVEGQQNMRGMEQKSNRRLHSRRSR